jgi:hypothetical protein
MGGGDCINGNANGELVLTIKVVVIEIVIMGMVLPMGIVLIMVI